MAHIMYRNNKANLWLRTICVTVALLGMLFFTHSQFSSAAAPTSIGVSITTSATSTTLDVNDEFTFTATLTLAASEVIKTGTNVVVTYAIGSAGGKTVSLGSSSPYTGDVTIASGDTGAITFTKITFETDVQASADYTTTSGGSPTVTLTDATLTAAGVIETITDVTSVAVGITSSGDDTDVTIGETVTVDVNVGASTEGVPVVADGAVAGDTTAHKLLYDVAASGTATEVALVLGDNNTHFTVTLPAVTSSSAAGAFTFESVKLSLQNGDGDATTAEEKTYTVETTSAVVVSLTDAGLTINPTNVVTDVTVLASATAVNNTAGVGDNVTFTAWITNSTNGLVLNATVNYKITGAKNATGSVVLEKQGLNGTSMTLEVWNGTFTVANDTQAGNLTIESILVWAQSTAPSQTANQTITAADAMATNVVEVDIPAPVDPPADKKTTTTPATTATTAANASSSSESTSDSPVSIFAVFILIASVSLAVGVYTLRRRQ